MVKKITFANFKVGGIRFVRVHRLQLAFCVVRADTNRRALTSQPDDYRAPRQHIAPHIYTENDPFERPMMALAIVFCAAAFLKTLVF